LSEAFDPAIFEFYAALPQQGPGRDSETLAVLRRIADQLPPKPLVADLGCGTGRTTLALAEVLPSAQITAVDFSEIFCRHLRDELAARGLTERVHVEVADMAVPPIAPDSLDLIWSEGAAYSIGFENALKVWRPLLKADGLAVISECTWLSGSPPAEIAEFWAAAYPAMGTREENVARAIGAGYEVVKTRTLSLAGWSAYYDPITKAAGKAAHLGPAFIAELEREMAIFAASAGSYGYVFYVLKRHATG
jgi:serine/threonine-protein kinase HipA